MSMLKCFFYIENKEENKKLFNNLYIEKSKYISEQGKDSLDEISQEDFNKIIYMKDSANYEDALKYLTEYLYKYYK